jgi:hypothetical protein
MKHGLTGRERERRGESKQEEKKDGKRDDDEG